jgi:hypothetical protein
VLTVNQPTASTTNISICPSELPYSWNDLTFNAAGSQTANFSNSVGCDSTATLVLTVNQPTTSTTNISICPSELPYSWNDLTFDAAGTQTTHLTNNGGCDSAATLSLTILSPTSSTTNVTACETYTWNGSIYNNSGTYSQTFAGSNSVGCDSIANLNLTIKRATRSLNNVTVCNTYTWNGVTYSNSGYYTRVFTGGNSVGCDSIAALNLTVNKLSRVLFINGSSDPCNGMGAGYTLRYYCNKVSFAQGYIWTVDGGAVISTTDTSAMIRFNKIPSGRIYVKAYQICDGDTLFSNTVNKSIKTLLPAATAINGASEVCSGVGAGNFIAYTAKTSTNANAYFWTIPSGAILLSGQGTDTVKVQFAKNFAADNILLASARVCGNDTFFSATSKLVVKLTLPIVSGISGLSDVCSGIGVGNKLGYKAIGHSNIGKLIWGIPAGAILTNQVGDSAYVRFPDNFLSGSITVTPVRVCGVDTLFSTSKSINLKTLLPTQPSAITASSNIDPCSKLGSSETYSTPATVNTTSYLWETTGAGATVTSSGGINGVVNYSGSFISGTVKVTAQRTCGTSMFSSLSRIMNTKVALPISPSVSGYLTPCRNASNIYIANSSNATGYNWNVTSGLSVSSASGNAATIATGSGFSKGSVSVIAIRSCGVTLFSSTARTINLVRPSAGCPSGSKANSSEHLSSSNGFTMYPNPAKGLINLNVETLEGAGSIVVTDLYGKTVKTQALSMGTNTVDIANLSKGIYFVSTITNEGKTTKKLIVE